MTQAQPGWHTDPRGGTYERWFDGEHWTTATRPFGSSEAAPSITARDYASSLQPPAVTGPAGDDAATGLMGYPGGPTGGYPSASSPTYPLPGAPGTGYPGSPQYPGSAVTGYGGASSPNPAYPGTPGYGATYGVPGGAYTAPGYASAVVAPPGVWRGPVDDRPLVTGLGQAIAVCFSRYASFDGRAGRAEFWYFYLFNALVSIGGIVLAGVGTALFYGAFALVGVVWLAGLALLVPSLAVMVRRLRDAGQPWALIFITFVPFGAIVLLVMCAQPSKYA